MSRTMTLPRPVSAAHLNTVRIRNGGKRDLVIAAGYALRETVVSPGMSVTVIRPIRRDWRTELSDASIGEVGSRTNPEIGWEAWFNTYGRARRISTVC